MSVLDKVDVNSLKSFINAQIKSNGHVKVKVKVKVSL